MLKVNNVSKSYGKRNILNNLSLEANAGEFVAIIGPSGRGKTTLLNIITRLEQDHTGKVMYNGEVLDSNKKIMNFYQDDLGYLLQNFGLVENMTIKENIDLYVDNVTNEQIVKLLNEFKIGANVNEKIYNLSGGEQQRVALIRVLLKCPNIILADEPTGNLDQDNKALIYDELKKISQAGKIVIVVSHDLEITKWADKVINL